MIGVLETCKCGRKFLRGIYPQKKCYICDSFPIVQSTYFEYAKERIKKVRRD